MDFRFLRRRDEEARSSRRSRDRRRVGETTAKEHEAKVPASAQLCNSSTSSPLDELLEEEGGTFYQRQLRKRRSRGKQQGEGEEEDRSSASPSWAESLFTDGAAAADSPTPSAGDLATATVTTGAASTVTTAAATGTAATAASRQQQHKRAGGGDTNAGDEKKKTAEKKKKTAEERYYSSIPSMRFAGAGTTTTTTTKTVVPKTKSTEEVPERAVSGHPHPRRDTTCSNGISRSRSSTDDSGGSGGGGEIRHGSASGVDASSKTTMRIVGCSARPPQQPEQHGQQAALQRSRSDATEQINNLRCKDGVWITNKSNTAYGFGYGAEEENDATLGSEYGIEVIPSVSPSNGGAGTRITESAPHKQQYQPYRSSSSRDNNSNRYHNTKFVNNNSYCHSTKKGGGGDSLATSSLKGDDPTVDDTDASIISMVNASDRALMEKSESPGSLRLTAEGLKQHERKVVLGSSEYGPVDVDEYCVDNDDDDGDSNRIAIENIQVWKRKRDNEKWKRKLREEREQALSSRLTSSAASMLAANQSISLPETEEQGSSSKKIGGLVPSRLFPSRRKEDVADISLAPLADLEQFHCAQETEEGEEGKNDRTGSGIVSLFRKRSGSSGVHHRVNTKAQAILEQERIAYVEARRVQRASRHLHNKADEEERQRIQSMREAYLERERAKEASASQSRPATTSDAIGKGTWRPHEKALFDTDCSVSSGEDEQVQSSPLASISLLVPSPSLPPIFRDFHALTLSDPCQRTTSPATMATIPEMAASSTSLSTSGTSPLLPPCAVCGIGERTHIASPCMHFSFCGRCVSEFQRMGPNNVACPICLQPNVTFSSVSM